ncbi:MAG: hypothetical protein RL250_1755 [Verrucomicrobiota bacterium]|jgi:hypothetical protein
MRLPALLAAAALLAACRPAPKVSTYEVKAEPAPAKEAVAAAPAPRPAMQATPAMQAEAAQAGQPTWAELPAGWSVGPANAMRKGSWTLTGPNGTKAEVAVTVFPGNVGGLTANVNRWRGQIGLPPASEADILATAKPGKVGADEAQRFVMVSADGAKSTDAFLVPKNGSTWFCKLSGDTAAVQAQADAFTRFLAQSKLP